MSRTNSDCCPDYFTHCEGLTLPSPDELTRPDGPYVPQEAEPPVTIMPPTGCEFGLLNISSDDLSCNPLRHRRMFQIPCAPTEELSTLPGTEYATTATRACVRLT